MNIRPRRCCAPSPRRSSNGRPAFTPDEAEAAAKELGGPLWVVKSQIHAGGRGKGKFKEASAGDKGGVRLARSVARGPALRRARCSGATLVTVQTGPAGKQVNRLYIEEGAAIDKEFYLSALVDRDRRQGRFRAFDRRRRQHRGRRAQDAGEDPFASRSIPRPASCRTTAARRRGRSGSPAIWPSRSRA